MHPKTMHLVMNKKACMKIALRINQNLSEAHYNLGNAYLKTGNYDKAVAEYKLYISGKGDHPIVFYNLGHPDALSNLEAVSKLQ
ncbi:MAG: tetratricopeptide repeat protein [Planctomycetes bacterium]|nr:tetratricopeptide repeat protein [Planctomycetota bacterium]